MVPIIITVIIFIILVVYLITTSITHFDFVYILVNIPLLLIVLTRAYFEVRHKKILYPYLISLGITTALFLLFFKYLKIPFLFWQVLFITIVFVIAEIINLVSYSFKENEIDTKFNNWLRKKK